MKNLLYGILAASFCLAFAGCDNGTDSIHGDMYMDPGAYTFTSGSRQTVTIRVYGAVPPFKWSVSDPSVGTLTGVTDAETDIDAATYTRIPGKYGRNTVIVDDSRGWRASCAIMVKEGIDAP